FVGAGKQIPSVGLCKPCAVLFESGDVDKVACGLANKSRIVPKFIRIIPRCIKVVSGRGGESAKDIHLSYARCNRMHRIVPIELESPFEWNALCIIDCNDRKTHKAAVGVVGRGGKHIVILSEAKSPCIVGGAGEKFKAGNIRLKAVYAL